MGGLRPVSRRDFIARLRELGFDGPFQGTGDDPQFMQRGRTIVRVPNPHKRRDIGVPLLKRIIRNAGLSNAEWLGKPTREEVTNGEGHVPS